MLRLAIRPTLYPEFISEQTPSYPSSSIFDGVFTVSYRLVLLTPGFVPDASLFQLAYNASRGSRSYSAVWAMVSIVTPALILDNSLNKNLSFVKRCPEADREWQGDCHLKEQPHTYGGPVDLVIMSENLRATPAQIGGAAHAAHSTRGLQEPASGSDMARLERHNAAMQRLITAVQELSLARNLDAIMAVVRRGARELTGADGATVVLRDGDYCHYVDEDAIAPLWKGQRFPMSMCISGWSMLNRQAVAIEDIYTDSRVPADAYSPTFVKSLVMVPIRAESPIGAIGNYWSKRRRVLPEEIELLQALANTTAVAMENVRVYKELEDRVAKRTEELEAVHRELGRRTQEQLSRQATLLDLAHDAILVGDLDGRLRYWNKGAERLHGWKAEEVIGRKTTDFLYQSAFNYAETIRRHSARPPLAPRSRSRASR